MSVTARPPCCLGSISSLCGSRGLFLAQMNSVKVACICLKYAEGMRMGSACIRYRNFGRIVIFNMLHRPIHEYRPECHWLSRDLTVRSNGGKFSSYSRENVQGISVPRYFRVVFVHFKLKLACRCVNWECEISTPIASDLVKLIFRLESIPYVLNSRGKSLDW